MSAARDKQRLLTVEVDGSRRCSYGALQTTELSHENSPAAFNSDRKSQQKPTNDARLLSWTQKKLIVGMVVVSLLNGSLVAVMIPFFPVEADSRGVPQTTISAVFSCFAMMQLLLSPVVGRVAPVIGVTRLYNIGIATAGLTTIVFGTLCHIRNTQLFVTACFLVRLVEAAGTAAVSGCAFTIIGNQFADRASRMVALVSAAQSVGLSMAPAIGGGLYAAAGFGLPFYVVGSTMVVAAMLNLWLMPPIDRPERTTVPYFSMLRVFSKSVKNWLCLLVVFQYSFAFLTFDASVAPYANDVLGITPSTLGLYFTVATVVFALTSYLWARVTERARNPYAIMFLCLLASSASLLVIPPSPLLGLAPHWWLLGLGMSLMEGFFGGAYIPCFQLMLAAGVRQGLPDDLVTQAFVSSVFWSTCSLGCVVEPPLGGLMVEGYGFPIMMTCLAGLVLLVSLLTMLQAVFTACSGRGPATSQTAAEEQHLTG